MLPLLDKWKLKGGLIVGLLKTELMLPEQQLVNGHIFPRDLILLSEGAT